MLRLSSSAWRASPVGVRMLRTTPSRLGMLTTPMPSSSAATIDVDKFVTGESVAEHQVRVRHDNNAFRTHNYAVIGEPLPLPQDDVILDARGDIDEEALLALTTSRLLEAELTSLQQYAQFGGPWGDN